VGIGQAPRSVEEIAAIPAFSIDLPGEVEAPVFDLRLRVEVSAPFPLAGQQATLRNWKAGDRVRLRYSSGPRKVKEVLERMKVTGTSRNLWPVLEWGGRILWMQGVELEPEPGIHVVAASLRVAGSVEGA
jgi:tRNA(Ile)-lysidine synthase